MDRSNEASTLSRLDLRPILTFTADILGLVTLLAFCVALVLNSLLFQTWGLSFLHIAAPSDVMLSGLAIAVRFLPVAIAMAASPVIIYVTDQRRVNRFLDGPIDFPFVAAAIIWVGLTIYAFIFDEFLKSALYFLFSIWIIRRRLEINARYRPKNRYRSIMIDIFHYLIAALFLMLVAIQSIEKSGDIAYGGVFESPTYFYDIETGRRDRLLWLGERYAVVRRSGEARIGVLRAEEIKEFASVRSGRSNAP